MSPSPDTLALREAMGAHFAVLVLKHWQTDELCAKACGVSRGWVMHRVKGRTPVSLEDLVRLYRAIPGLVAWSTSAIFGHAVAGVRRELKCRRA